MILVGDTHGSDGNFERVMSKGLVLAGGLLKEAKGEQDGGGEVSAVVIATATIFRMAEAKARLFRRIKSGERVRPAPAAQGESM